jgi:hypothetical protein
MAKKNDNLDNKGFDKLTAKEQRKIASMGGKASAEARRKKRDLRLALEMLLEKEFKDKKGVSRTGTEVITAKLFEQAAKGNVKAFETIRATVGQDPVQKVQVADVTQDVINEVESIVNETE